jgi:serine/threonine protein phosphatase PrpC
MMDSDFNWESYGLTHVGCVRKRNEDNIRISSEKGMWLVADGAGGHANGHEASQTAVDTLRDYQPTYRLGNDVRHLKQLLSKANEQLIARYKESSELSGTTASILVTDGKTAACIWSGDSLIFRLRDNKLSQLSQDHNRVEEFILEGFDEKECERIPHAQQLTQALGASESLCLQTRWVDLKEGDLFIICSDGLTKESTDSDIEIIAKKYSESPKELTKQLVNMTVEKGARDNVSVISCLFF